jgi:glycerol-3-phosphate cytidylyltransferase
LDYLSVCEQVRADIFVIGQDWGKKPHNHNVEKYFENMMIDHSDSTIF